MMPSPTLSALIAMQTCTVLWVALSSAAVAQQGSSIRLVPKPQELRVTGDLNLAGGVLIRSSNYSEDKAAIDQLYEALDECHLATRDPRSKASIDLLRVGTPKAAHLLAIHHLTFSSAMHDEGYILLSEGPHMYDIAATSAGVFYGAQTIRQLLTKRGGRPTLQAVEVRDWPAMKYRAQDDDLSRGPFPTLEYQKKQIRTLASFKINIYSPYFENTLQYRSDPLMGPPGGTMSRADVQELVRYAQQYHVTILPQQEAFGHLHHTLMYEQYAEAAEIPHGSVLAPGQPQALALAKRWFGEVAEMFPGPFLHIGADETDDLGLGRTRAEVATRGLVPVYIDFVNQIHDALIPLHKRLLFWGDVAMTSPSSVHNLPHDMIAVAWQYSMQPKGFDPWITPFRAAGMETWVAPSANRGNRIFPDNDNNLRTIQGFVAAGQRLGATGVFNTVWNDGGEGIFDQNWYGVLFGAAAGWQSGSSDIASFEQSYGAVFHNDASGEVNQAEMLLMQAHMILDKAGLQAKNALFWEDPWSSAGQQHTLKILPVAHELRLVAEEAIVLLERAKAQPDIKNVDALDAMELGARKMDFIAQKFQQAQEMRLEYAYMYAHRGDVSMRSQIADISFTLSGDNGQCQDLRDGYGLLRDLFATAWLKESRPYWLNNVTATYDTSMQLWISRGMAIRAAGDAFETTGTLPPPQELGIPGNAIEAR